MPFSLSHPVIKYRLVIIILLHALFAALALTISFLLRFDFTLGGFKYTPYCLLSLPINIVIVLVCSGIFNLYQGIWRYVSVDDLEDIVKASAMSSLVFMFVIVLSGRFSGYPRSIYVLNFAIFIFLNGGTRILIRIFRESFVPQVESVHNVLIVGAGSAGNEIAKTIKSAKRKDYQLQGFIDKDASLIGRRISGIKVLGDLTSIRQHIRKYRVHEIFIGIPEATNKQVEEIIAASRVPDWDVKFKIVPSMLDIMSGKFQVDQIRDVSINEIGRASCRERV